MRKIQKDLQIVGQIMLFLNVCFETVRHTVQVARVQAADEAIGFHRLLHTLQLITKLAESVDDQTLNDGQQDDNDEEEESDVEQDTVDFVIIVVRVLDFIIDTTTSSYNLECNNNMLIIL